MCVFHPRDDDAVYPVEGVLPGSGGRLVSVMLMYVRVKGKTRGVDVMEMLKLVEVNMMTNVVIWGR